MLFCQRVNFAEVTHSKWGRLVLILEKFDHNHLQDVRGQGSDAVLACVFKGYVLTNAITRQKE